MATAINSTITQSIPPNNISINLNSTLNENILKQPPFGDTSKPFWDMNFSV